MNNAVGSRRLEILGAPSVNRSHGFQGKTLTVCRAGKDPPGFRSVPKRRLNGAFHVGESHFAEEVSCGFLFDGPVSEPQKQPMASVTEQAAPRLLSRLGNAGYKTRHYGISPERGHVRKIFDPMDPEYESL